MHIWKCLCAHAIPKHSNTVQCHVPFSIFAYIYIVCVYISLSLCLCVCACMCPLVTNELWNHDPADKSPSGSGKCLLVAASDGDDDFGWNLLLAAFWSFTNVPQKFRMASPLCAFPWAGYHLWTRMTNMSSVHRQGIHIVSSKGSDCNDHYCDRSLNGGSIIDQ